MIQITITGNTADELSAAALQVVAMLNADALKGGAAAILSQSEQARLRGDATVVPPKADKVKKDKANKPKAEADDTADETEGDAAEETETASEGEALTIDDVKKLLIAVKEANPKEPTIIASIVKEYGGATKISDVDAKKLPAVAARCRELLAKAKKK